MSNSINLSFRHFVLGEGNQVKIDDEISATVAKRNGVLDFKSILITAKDGELDDAKASEQEAIRQLINNRAGAVDFLKSRNIFDLNGFAPGTSAVVAAKLVLDAEAKGETFQLRPPPAAPSVAVRLPSATVVSTGSAELSAKVAEQTKDALAKLHNTYGIFELKDFPPRINPIQALAYVERGYADVAKTEVEQTYKTTGLAVLQKFADDFPSVKRLLNADKTALKDGVIPELRALQLLKEEDAAKATLLERFKIDFDKLEPEPTGTAVAMLRLQLGGVELPSVAEAKAIDTLKTKLPNNDDYTALLASFPQGTTPSQVLSYWELTQPTTFAQANAARPQPPAPGTNMATLLNRLAADELIQKGIFNLNAFPANTTTLQAWQMTKEPGAPAITPVKDNPSLQGPKIEGTSGIIKIRTPKEAMAKLAPAPAVAAQPATLLKGFDVVNQLVQWRVELKDPTQLATISQQGISREALLELTQPIPAPAASDA